MKTVKVVLSELKTEYNPRVCFDGMDELVESIKSVGILQPIVVREQDAGKGWVLVDGARRLMALKKLGISVMDAVVVDAVSADEAQMAAHLREDLNLIERSRGFLRLTQKYPARHSASSIAKAFGCKKKDVERMMSLAKRLDPSVDKIVGPANLDVEALEMLADVPKKYAEMVARESVKAHGNVRWALQRAFHPLAQMSDALNSEALVSSGRAFRVGEHSIYAVDKATYEEAKKAYEEATRKKYGAPEKQAKARTEKEMAAQKKKRADRKKRIEEARKAVKSGAGKFLCLPPSAKDHEGMGIEICERHLKSDACRELLSIFGVKFPDRPAYGELQKKVWGEVFAPVCVTAASLERLRTLLSAFPGDERTWSEAWASIIEKGGSK